MWAMRCLEGSGVSLLVVLSARGVDGFVAHFARFLAVCGRITVGPLVAERWVLVVAIGGAAGVEGAAFGGDEHRG